MATPCGILIIDDEESMRVSCRQILSRFGCRIKEAADGYKGLELLRNESFDIVILDLKLPGLNGMKVLKRVKEIDPETIVIVTTGYATVESAVEALKDGAYDYLPKPFTPDELRVIVRRALEKRTLMLENVLLRQYFRSVMEWDAIIGQNKAIRRINKLVQRVGPTNSTVLIAGESGTGKELVARAIHTNSARSTKPFVTVDCSANLFEGDLFGYVKGSSAGATTTKHGYLELANGGTVFFDEIANIGINVQAKLLRAIQEGEITKVGSTQTIKIDIRIIAATNKNLLQAMKKGTFREDLFYHLSAVLIHLPPLRERKDDIPLLANYFLEKYNKKRGKSIKDISDRAMKALVNYDWPGNVRELENVIERAVMLTDSERIEPSDLYYYGLSPEPPIPEEKKLVDVEREHIERTLRMFNGHKVKTAKALGIDRKTLWMKMKKYGINEISILKYPLFDTPYLLK